MRYTTKRSGGPECEVGNVLCAEKLAPCMSEMGQTRPICDVRVTSAIPPTAAVMLHCNSRSEEPKWSNAKTCERPYGGYQASDFIH